MSKEVSSVLNPIARSMIAIPLIQNAKTHDYIMKILPHYSLNSVIGAGLRYLMFGPMIFRAYSVIP